MAGEIDQNVGAFRRSQHKVEGAVGISGVSSEIAWIQWARYAIGMLHISGKKTTFGSHLIQGWARYGFRASSSNFRALVLLYSMSALDLSLT